MSDQDTPGMQPSMCGRYAIMLDEANGHYGWLFRRHPDGMWVSTRPSTDPEFKAAEMARALSARQSEE